jgi:hypothetical protein
MLGPSAAVRRTLGVALAGVLLGHGVAYALAQPDAHARAGMLASTGHAYLHLLEAPAVALAAVALAAAFLAGVLRRVPAGGPAAAFRRLAAVQVAVFAALELAERAGAPAPLGAAAQLRLLAIGVAVQVAVAAAGAWLLSRLERAGAQVTAARGVAAVAPPGGATRIAVPAAGPSTSPAIAVPRGRAPPRAGRA